jgi:hypothetical protein
MSAYIVPNNGPPTSVNFTANSTANISPIYGSSCSQLGCKASISIPNNLNTHEFYLRISTIYAGSNVLSLTATGTSGQSLPLFGAEYLIDSTGRSAGVLRRVQVAIPVIQATDIPGYAIQTTYDICKEFYIIPSSAGGSGDPIPSISGSTSGDCTSEGY